ncbi:MAG: hypothetical protein ACI8QZ_003003 [Chlamydiales bacterium]|jgi:hypothetical protein
MKSALEYNLERLLTRAYEPARPRTAFSVELLGRVLETVPQRRPEWRVSSVVRPVFQGLAAAALLLLVLFGWDRGNAPSGGGLDQLVASGEIALRVDGGPWFAASSPTIPWLAGRLEAVVPEAAGSEALAVLALTGDRIELEAGAHARLMARAAGPVLQLDAGRAQLTKTPHSPRWRVIAGGGEIDWDAGRLGLDAGTGEGATSVGVPYGRGALVASGVDLAGGSRGSLNAGSWTPEAEVVASAVVGGGAERETLAVASPERTGPETPVDPDPSASDADRNVVRGNVRSRIAEAPLQKFRVWLRREVNLPDVSEPVCHEIDDAQGAFELGDLQPGHYSVLVEAEGHAAWRTVRALVGAEALVFDVTLGAGGSLRGYVIDARTDTPVVGALVLGLSDLPHQLVGMQEFDPEPMPRAHAVTDANGAFELRNLSTGKHNVRASHPEHASSWIGVPLLREGEERDLETFRLGQGGSLAGRVERHDGRPLAGAVVVASRIDGDGMAGVFNYGVAISAADGSYLIEHLSADRYVVMNVASELGMPAEWTILQQAHIRAGDTVRVDFLAAAQVRRISGRLLDARGEPIAGWFVTLARDAPGGGFDTWAATGTAADGSFEFVGIEAGPHGLYMGRRANDTFIRCRSLEVPELGERVYTLRLPDTEIAGGLIDARDGTPVVGGVYLERFDAVRSSWIFAGRDIAPQDGRFSFPFLEPGRYRMAAVDVPGLANRLSEPLEIAAGEQLAIELGLSVGGTVTLQCRDGLGRPVCGARLLLECDGVALRPPMSMQGSTWKTDREGRITVAHLPLVTLRATVDAPGFATRVESVTPSAVGSLLQLELRAEGY